jgi:hypothetical protein
MFFCISMSNAQADMICSGINYQCNLEKKELHISSLETSCGSFEEPFGFIDGEFSGQYGVNRVNTERYEYVLKDCAIGRYIFHSLIKFRYCRNGAAASVSIYRSEPPYHLGGKPYKHSETGKLIEPSKPLYHTKYLGGGCVSDIGDSEIIIKLSDEEKSYTIEFK